MNSINPKSIAIIAVILVSVGVGTYFFQNAKEQKEQNARNALYQAIKTYDSEVSTLSEAEKAAGAKLDVDSKFTKTVSELNAVLNSATSTARSRYEAGLKLANLYLEYSEDQSLVKAIEVLKKVTDWAESSFQKSSAYFVLGSALERSGQFKESLDAFQKALKQGEDGFKNEILLSLVKVSVKTQDLKLAKTFSEQLKKDAPESKASQEAQKLVSQN